MRIRTRYVFAIVICRMATTLHAADLPNVLLVLADDLGYGDVSCYNSEAKVTTSNVDRLAAQGMRFTDAHSPSTVCTPTRYSILTGRMAFRTGMRGVFDGVGGPCLIERGRLTLPQMLRNCGYATACIGKWHVGLTMFDREGNPINKNGRDAVLRIDYSRSIPDGPIHRGFDRFFGTAACPTTDWLYAWIDQDRIPVPPTETIDRSQLPAHPYSRDCRPGQIAPDFEMENVDLVFLEKSKQFLSNHASMHPDQPFFLFHSMQAVHLPSFAAEPFKGKSSAGPHGDFILEMDHIVGELMKTLDDLGFADNTIVIFTSDNGPEVTSVIHMRKDHDHDGARPWRGMKRDNWEGGHRVPTIVRWPATVRAGSEIDQPFCLTDVMATLAAVAGYKLPDDAAEDSFNFLPLLQKGSTATPIRPYILHQTISLALSIRRGPWKLLDHQGSGGNDYSRSNLAKFALPDASPDSDGQLYNLQEDPRETHNLHDEQPAIVANLKAELRKYRDAGRSAPLPRQ